MISTCLSLFTKESNIRKGKIHGSEKENQLTNWKNDIVLACIANTNQKNIYLYSPLDDGSRSLLKECLSAVADFRQSIKGNRIKRH